MKLNSISTRVISRTVTVIEENISLKFHSQVGYKISPSNKTFYNSKECHTFSSSRGTKI